jgi:hypothetical protein
VVDGALSSLLDGSRSGTRADERVATPKARKGQRNEEKATTKQSINDG